MILIFGTTCKQKLLGLQKRIRCGRCNNISNWQVIENTYWFCLFFLPLIPMKRKYYEKCPICQGSTELSKEEALASIVSEG